jgi:hypothetical protein
VRIAFAAGIAVLVLAGAAGAVVNAGSVTPNVGAAGIKLGMTRAQVIAKLGKPVYKNANGYMQFGNEKKNVLFDVYLDTSTSPQRVRLLGISGRNFCLTGGGPCMLRPGGVGKLKARYGKALKTVKLEDGEKVIWLKGTLGGCKVFTDFGEAGRPNSAPLIMILIGYQSGHYC